ncbi:MAG: tellurite-like stress resistance cysteine protease StiP [Candidatus Melainabacteria bacterium]|nr:tellurite-like stress resistance cysteine protease StiP [Candidatus Melainabacteria bacterium]
MNNTYPGFSGSYHLEDCTFLLKQIGSEQISIIETTDLAKQEAEIQSGEAPYWLRVSREKTPAAEQLTLYREAMNSNKIRFARDLASLAKEAYKQYRQLDEVTIVSLARAGTPVGALLNRALKAQGLKCNHYSISIVRDKVIGLDLNALSWICENHAPESILFVDGWTGKGGMTLQLAESVKAFNEDNGTQISPSLWVVSDLAGYADFSADFADYLLPYSVFNGVISGLVSRTIYNPAVLSPADFHGAYLLENLTEHDLTNSFIDEIWVILKSLLESPNHIPDANVFSTEALSRQNLAKRTVENLMRDFNISDPNQIKIGIGESTRAMTRRLPQALIICNSNEADIQHLLLKARTRNVPILEAELYCGKAAVVVGASNQ